MDIVTIRYSRPTVKPSTDAAADLALHSSVGFWSFCIHMPFITDQFRQIFPSTNFNVKKSTILWHENGIEKVKIVVPTRKDAVLPRTDS